MGFREGLGSFSITLKVNEIRGGSRRAGAWGPLHRQRHDACCSRGPHAFRVAARELPGSRGPEGGPGHDGPLPHSWRFCLLVEINRGKE